MPFLVNFPNARVKRHKNKTDHYFTLIGLHRYRYNITQSFKPCLWRPQIFNFIVRKPLLLRPLPKIPPARLPGNIAPNLAKGPRKAVYNSSNSTPFILRCGRSVFFSDLTLEPLN